VIDFFTSIGGAIMLPLYYAISFVLVGFHNVFGDIFGPSSCGPR
jgi:YidC/Oxa1 family membrane protein insertase